MDMSPFVAPKSNQLNADDLVSGPRTITITRVSATGAADQPVAVYYEGDGDRPYLPCKSMRRVMISAWGADASQYVGRAMRIYRDPKVAFGGMEVGGIRISHMSDLERDMQMALTVTKAKRAPYVVKPLEAAKPAAPAKPKATPEQIAARFRGKLAEAHDAEAVAALLTAADATLIDLGKLGDELRAEAERKRADLEQVPA